MPYNSGPSQLTDRRLEVLEEEVELCRRHIEDLIAEREFVRELGRPGAPGVGEVSSSWRRCGTQRL